MATHPHEPLLIEASANYPGVFKAMRGQFDLAIGALDLHDAMRRNMAQALSINPFVPTATAPMFAYWESCLQWMGMTKKTFIERLKHMPYANSPEMAELMWGIGESMADTATGMAAHNGEFFTHNKNGEGTLNSVRYEDIAPHFAKGKPWPKLVLTSNHAECNSSKDLAGVMRNFTALYDKVFGKDDFVLERYPDNDRDLAGKTLIVSNLYTEPHQDKNGAAMIWRFNQLKEHETLLDRMIVDRKAIRPASRYPEIELQKRAPSPAAIQLGKLMLKLMVENPQSINEKDGTFIRDELGGEPPILRDDASAIAGQISLAGYSKASNTVCDAVRYMMFELKGIGREGGSIFQQRVHEGEPPVAVKTSKQVRDIITRIPILCIAGPDIKMTREEELLGMRRLRINSNLDIVSGHFLQHEKQMPPSRFVAANDEVMWIDGIYQRSGHHPDDMLGHRPHEKEAANNPVLVGFSGNLDSDAANDNYRGPGYLLNNPHAIARVKHHLTYQPKLERAA